MDLGDGVLGPALRAEAVAARLEVRLEDRLEHQLQGCLARPGPARSGSRACGVCRSALGIIRSRTGRGAKRPSLELSSQLGEQPLAPPRTMERRFHPVHAGRPGPPVAPHPTPRHNAGTPGQQTRLYRSSNRRSGSSVAHWCSLVWISSTRASASSSVGPRLVGVHRRPPGIPAPLLQTRCLPSPCGRLSRPRTTTEAPSHLRAISRRRACPLAAWLAGREGGPRMVPTFTMHRLTGSAPSFSPAASPRVRRRPSPWPPGRRSPPASESPTTLIGRTRAAVPAHIHQIGAGSPLEGVHHWFLSYTFPSCLPDPGRLAVPTRPVVVGAAPTLPCASRVRLPPASPSLLRQADGGVLSSPPGSWRLVAHEIIGVSDRDRAARLDALIRAVTGSGDRLHPVQGDV